MKKAVNTFILTASLCCVRQNSKAIVTDKLAEKQRHLIPVMGVHHAKFTV
jgi:hypothetical protein